MLFFSFKLLHRIHFVSYFFLTIVESKMLVFLNFQETETVKHNLETLGEIKDFVHGIVPGNL